MKHTLTAFVWKENNQFVAQCLEVDIASQGKTEAASLDELHENLKEVLELCLKES